jgi:hypothetical protein
VLRASWSGTDRQKNPMPVSFQLVAMQDPEGNEFDIN